MNTLKKKQIWSGRRLSFKITAQSYEVQIILGAIRQPEIT